MNEPLNPYAASTATLAEPAAYLVDGEVVPAGKGLRLANFLIDYIMQFVVSFVFGAIIVLVGGQDGVDFINQTPGFLIGLPLFLIYYILCEATTSRTLGKLVTGTKVVNEQGGKPTFGQILGRTFSRLIPFEAFSFLGETSRGWHDRFPHTFVVKSR
ncbi:RDD family protein [Novipirellula caenicola]|uniref:RDD domain-containing protein n=1 Tax=Novipirellula caenicola TaxID=1536901 RepID=A0ABP9VJH1_9BACT